MKSVVFIDFVQYTHTINTVYLFAFIMSSKCVFSFENNPLAVYSTGQLVSGTAELVTKRPKTIRGTFLIRIRLINYLQNSISINKILLKYVLFLFRNWIIFIL